MDNKCAIQFIFSLAKQTPLSASIGQDSKSQLKMYQSPQKKKL